METVIKRYSCDLCGAAADVLESSGPTRLPLFWIRVCVTGRGERLGDKGMVDVYTHVCSECRKIVVEAVPEGTQMSDPCYVIRHDADHDEFWHNTDGWVSRSAATVYTGKERAVFDLPLGGEWVPQYPANK